MSEIEKMMQNANIKQNRMCEWTCKDNDFCNAKCEQYGSTQLYYPPFAAEKQLKIVKMILFSTWWLNLKRLQFSEKFDEGLAQMINELWEDLTPEEKQQVKGILE